MHGEKALCMLCLTALALQLAAICTPHWSVKKLSPSMTGMNTSTDVSIGLWKACGKAWESVTGFSGDINACLDLPIDGWKSFPKNSLHACRAFAITGAALMFCALMCSVYMRNKTCQSMCLILGGICSLVAMSVWAGELLKLKVDNGAMILKFDPGYSFWLVMSAGIVSLLSGVLQLVYTVRGERSSGGNGWQGNGGFAFKFY